MGCGHWLSILTILQKQLVRGKVGGWGLVVLCCDILAFNLCKEMAIFSRGMINTSKVVRFTLPAVKSSLSLLWRVLRRPMVRLLADVAELFATRSSLIASATSIPTV